MNKPLNLVLAIVVLGSTILPAATAPRPSSANVITQSPSDSPELAQENSDAMYLHYTSDGTVVLYIEANNGRTLEVLDVTDPANARRIAQVSLGARSAFDFELSTYSGVLIRYRDGSGGALLSLKKYKSPSLLPLPGLNEPSTARKLDDALVVTSSNGPAPHIPATDATYRVYDCAGASGLKLTATVPDVLQSIERETTGTLYLLRKDGLTVVRQPGIEQEQLENPPMF